MAAIVSVDGNVDDCADTAAGDELYSEFGHEFFIADCNFLFVDTGDDTFTRKFTDVRNATPINCFAVCFLQALADRMRGGTFGKSRQFEEAVFIDRVVVNCRYLENTLRQRSCFIHDKS